MSSASTRNFVLVNHDVTVLPFPDRSFDAVISINAIHHNRLRDIKRAVKEIYRVLSPKGLLFVNLTARAEIRDGEKVERGTYRTRDGTEKGILHHLFTASEIRSTFKDYRILQLTPPSEGKPHWLLLAEKR
jgi:ubiquinone/menaquinone biosynthesis C-methylase UbiE